MIEWHKTADVKPDEAYVVRTMGLVLGWFPDAGLVGDYDLCFVNNGRVWGDLGIPEKWCYLPDYPNA